VSPTVIVVGANDGSTGDPTYPLIRSRPSCKAVLIEPVPYLFAKLKATYATMPWCECVNVAIAGSSSTQTIYFINPEAVKTLPTLPRFFEELASFSKDRVLASLPEGFAYFLKDQIVSTVPLRTLMADRNISHVDVLQIDTEGFDYEVLKTFPFERSQPRLVCFEHCHLEQKDRVAAWKMLTEIGYRVERWGKDSVCLHNG